ncbi:piggyBac transposable element-derived protein 1 isoform X4 [Zalophus californianus]|uniref:PiggyBac transposable element-derived protein 1 isoform X4 n=1 Tax=Zalophus californianus TaxID=9704 RepID=A0A6P9FM96_ZALCA|nr:piggyBac transposable element-derived protein 1 isoform X4 [Zalophus californianus]
MTDKPVKTQRRFESSPRRSTGNRLSASMDEALPGRTPENGDSLVKVKEEDPTWEQTWGSWESSRQAQELCRLRFRQFCYREVTGPREALSRLQELCRRWLRPETHSKEQIVELLVLEQFLTILPEELQARVREQHPESGEQAVAVLEDLEKVTGDGGQQGLLPPGTSQRQGRSRVPAEEVVTKDGLFNAKKETSQEVEHGAEAPGIPDRNCVPQPPCTSVHTERTVAHLNTLKDRHPGDLWARMHISSLEYAAGDMTRKGRKKDKARVSELLQGLAFSGDSDVEEDNKLETHHAQKKLKMSNVPEKNWAKRDIKPSFPSWSALDSGLLNLKSEKLNPVELFELFFDDEIFNMIVNETNNYASQKNVNLEVTVQEIRCVFGILLLSGFVRRPRRGMYWEISDADQNLVRDAIRRDRFELIFSYLHFADNSHLDQKDKFTKLRPLIKQMNRNFLLYAPLEEYYYFDKTMCECFDSDQFLNGKPIRIGYKIWCGTTTQGYLVWFEPYQEESTVMVDKDLDLGLGGNLVMHFADVLLERGQYPYHLCFDSFFTSVKLVSALKKKGVKATGTIRENRTEKCPLMSTEHMRKMKKGYFDFRVEENEEIILCRWHGDDIISLCSNAVGIEPASELSCSADEDDSHQIAQPSIVKLYDECREGVAKMDQIISKYRVRIRSKKWYSILVSYIIDVAMNNAWQLHRACNASTSLDLLDFRRYVAHFYLEHNANLSD